MFAKLLKHEFRISRSLLAIPSLVALGVAVLAAVGMKLTVCGMAEVSRTNLALSTPLLGFSILGLVAYVFAGYFLLLAQFYRRKFTDEGYLTFTLPTSVHHIYLASLVNMLIWLFIISAVIIGGVMIVMLFGTSPYKFINTDIFRIADQLKEAGLYVQIWLPPDVVDILGDLARSFIASCSSLVLMTTCITMGATMAKKHKILAAIGVYFGISLLTSFVSSMLLVSNTVTGSGLDYAVTVETVLNVAILAAGYFITTNCMKNKLNLP